MLLHHRFVYTAKKYGKKLVLIDCATDRRISYSNALIASLILAEKFRKHEEVFIGVMLPPSAGALLTILGALMGGKTPVMINYSTGASDNILYAQNKCNFRTVVTSKALLEKINCPLVDGLVFIEDITESITIVDKLKAAMKAKLPASMCIKGMHGGDDDDNLVMLFTSGSEKEPKAVQLTHRNIASDIEGISKMIYLDDKDRMLANLPFFHVFGLTVNLWVPLYYGMTIISYASPIDYKMICSIIRDHAPTIMVGTPSFLWGYVRKAATGDFRSLRLVLCGADKCPEALCREFQEKHGITIYEGYGTTETSPVISVNTPYHNRPGSVGKILPGVQVRIENYENGDECICGEVGRIMVKGDIVMKGYFDDVEETSMRIRHGWYDTGDMGFFDGDGYLWHSGRLKRFVKIGGEMVSLVAVENILERFLPEDVFCCVVGFPDPVKGARIAAAVTKRIDQQKTLERMSDHLPNIALPSHFIVIEDLPKMGSGKIDFRKTTEMVQDILCKSG